MPVKLSLDRLRAHCGEELAASDWMVVSQEQVDRFAAATGDDQWIHSDPARAAESPFGGTIAHGFLTLSLLTSLLQQAVSIDGQAVTINYGLNRVRFVTPVRAGARIRGRFVPIAVEPIPEGSQVTWAATVDLEGSVRPACVAEWLVHYMG